MVRKVTKMSSIVCTSVEMYKIDFNSPNVRTKYNVLYLQILCFYGSGRT